MPDIDRREAILVRLEAVCAGVSGIKKVFRNRLDIPEHQRPAVVILDADEDAEDAPEGRGRPIAVSPSIMTMTPEIYIYGAVAAADSNVGTVLNGLKTALLKAILTDDSLLGLAKDGDIRFQGFATGLASGRSMEGEAGLSVQFRYMLFPDRM